MKLRILKQFCSPKHLFTRLNHNFHFCIVGSGPAGFYTADKLLAKENVVIDLYEKLPYPFGLVRSGVSPDHPEVKNVQNKFEEILQNPRVKFFGNVNVGFDLQISTLRKHYHGVVLAYGASDDYKLNLKGEDMKGVHSARSFVGWFNGLPEHRDDHYDLDVEKAVIIGNGNVALDVARMLLKKVEYLKETDITSYALEKLKRSKIREVHIIGRRGPVQAAFTTSELREMTKLEGSEILLAEELIFSEMDLQELKSRQKKRLFDLIRSLNSRRLPDSKIAYLHFLKSPSEFLGENFLRSVRFERNQLRGLEPGKQYPVGTGIYEDIPCGIAFRSIGYRSRPIPGIPFNERTGTVPHLAGKILENGNTLDGFYVVGWLKRGATGIIGTNIVDAEETVDAIFNDIGSGALPSIENSGNQKILEMLKSRSIRVVSYQDWKKIDKEEMARGQRIGKSREKLVLMEDIIKVIDGDVTF